MQENNPIYNLTFLDETTQYIFAIFISNKSFDIIEKEFSQCIAAVERETGQKVGYLRTDGEEKYQCEFTPVLKALEVKHEKTPS